MSLGSLGSILGGRRTFTPSNGRRPILTDEPWVIAKRVNFAKRLRSVLYGGHPPRCISKRLDTWAWLVREFVRLRDFRYIQLLDEARRFVKLHGHVECQEYDEVLDLDLLKAFQRYLYDRRRELETWRNRVDVRDKEQVLAGQAARDAKSLALLGICPLCVGSLPCKEDQIPAVALDGKGGLIAV